MSAFTGEGVNEAFDYLFKELYKQYGGEKSEEVKPVNGFGLGKPQLLQDSKKNKKCCS